MGVYILLCFVCAIPWYFKLWRLRSAIQTSSDNPPRFTGRLSDTSISTFTGYVKGTSTRSDTTVSGTISPTNLASGMSGGSGTITSHTIVTNEFRLVNPENHEERNFQVRDMNISLWDDQLVSVAWANPGGESSGKYLVAFNHSTGQAFFNDSDVKLVLLKRPLGGLMMVYIFFDIWNLWQLVLMAVYARMLNSRVKAFERTGVNPLLTSLSRTADRLSSLPHRFAAGAPSTTVMSSPIFSDGADGQSHRFCSKCGASIASGARFCTACGTAVAD